MEYNTLIQSIIFVVVYYLLSSFILVNIFNKTKTKKGIALIPVFRYIKFLDLLDLKWYYLIGLLISPANILLWIYLNIKVGKRFNRTKAFTVLLIFLPVIGYLVLSLDKSKYDANNTYKSKNFVFANIFSVVLTVVAALTLLIPTVFNNITKGLDLAGGFEILYQVKSADKKKLTTSELEDTYRTMLRRIDKLGVTEPELTIEGTDKIRVKLAGVTDPDSARNYITVAGELSFRDSNDKKLMDKSVLKNGSAAKVSQDESGNPAILLNIADKDKFYEVTSQISQTEDKLIVIWLDYDKSEGDSYAASKDKCGDFEDLNEAKCLSAATVKEGFSSNVIITGNFSEENAKNLVDLINSGSTNVKFKEISSKTVGSEFGEGALDKTKVAGVIGVFLILIFMVAYYRFSGAIASFAILIYTFATLLVFYLIDGVLTLPGIAAMVLGIGMAVDANVITCERIKEELRNNKSLKTSYKNGSKNSFSAILDSNVTTFIVAVILFAFGESSVKGFATMLIINIIMTMLIIIFITRFITKIFINTGFFDNKLKLYINYDKNKKKKEIRFDFIKHFAKFLTVSIIIIIIGVIAGISTGVNFGIDFTGGSDITISTKKDISKSELKKDLASLKLDMTEFTKDKDNNSYYIKVSNTLDENEVKSTNKYFEKKYNANTEIAVVSNLVKQDLIKNAIYSLFFAVIGIIVYISLRYAGTYAISAVLALLHDVFIIIALFLLFKFEISSIFIAAILTIIGYSINDTIVIFDRIREIHKNHKNEKQTKELMGVIVNESLRSTITRSINTTITTMLPIICLITLGSREILAFDIAILIGLIAGTYSSVLLSSQILSKFELIKINRKENKKNMPPKKGKKKKEAKKRPTELTVKGINA